ncbi:hypothetical protein ACJX0J_029293, partial [Zea mays]
MLVLGTAVLVAELIYLASVDPDNKLEWTFINNTLISDFGLWHLIVLFTSNSPNNWVSLFVAHTQLGLDGLLGAS